MHNYCILKQPANISIKTKIRVVPRAKLAKFLNRRNSGHNQDRLNGDESAQKFDIVKVRRNEKDSLLFAFDAAFKSFEE